MLKIISVSLLSIGLATSALAQSSGSSQDKAGDGNKVNPGAMHAPQATDDTTTKSIGTNCAPNQQTKGTASMPDKTGSTKVAPGESGANTNGQSSNC